MAQTNPTTEGGLESAALLEDMKLALRIKSSAYDDEIEGLILACKADLKIAGVDIVDETDPLTKQAIRIYVKGHFGYDENSERFKQAYESLKRVMPLASEYDEVV